MAFLSPLFLLGLLAAAIPVAIHLIRREKPPKVVFSSLRFLKASSRKLVLFQQIQQWLLLLIRAALICLLAFAFARPLFFQGTVAGIVDGDPESVVILLDVSMSMRADDTFEQAKQAARDVLADLGPGDEAGIVTFAGTTLAARELSTDHGQLRSFIENHQAPGYDVARFYPALRLGNDLLAAARYDRRRLVMISDFQANGMSQPDTGWMLAPGVNFTMVEVGTQRSRNLTLTDVRAPQQLIEGIREYDILARVRSTGSVHVDQAQLSLLVNGELQAEQSVELSRTSEAVLTLPAVFEADGSYQAEIRITGDEFELDNSYHFSVQVRPRVRVLVVNGDPSPNWYEDESHWFVLALEGVASSPFDVTTIETAGLDEQVLSEHDVVALLNVAALSNVQQAALETYVLAGGSAFVAPGDRVDAEAFNQQAATWRPGMLGEQILLAEGDYLLIADVNRRHPVLQPLELEWAARFESYWSVQPEDDVEVLMAFDNGAPALLERNIGEGRVLLFTSAMDLQWSNLPLQAVYLPFVHESLRYLTQLPERQRVYRVGDIIDLSADFGSEQTLQLLSPEGVEQSISAGNPYYRADAPGFLRVQGEAESVYAINTRPEASNLERISPDLLHDRIINPDTTPQQSQQLRAAQLVTEIENPQRIWWWIMILVLLMLLLETFIANRTYR